MSWLFAAPILTSIGAATLRFLGKDLSAWWIALPLIGIAVSMVSVVGIAALVKLPPSLNWVPFVLLLIAIPGTTVATLIKMLRVAL